MNDIKILAETDGYIVCVKPKGISSEDHNQQGMPSMLMRDGKKPLVVHRLDKEVSGVMVFAKTREYATLISKQIADKTFKKEYIAVVSGELQDSAVLEDLLFFDRAKNKVYPVKRERLGVKKASLEYKRLSTVEDSLGTLSLVRVILHTGRTHQIRVQFASRKHSILGDKKYGSAIKICSVALFSRMVGFKDFNGEWVEFCDLPENNFPWNLFSLENL